MTHSINYRGHSIRCSSAGEGEILLFLHGWPTNSILWNAQVEALKDRYQTITIDWLGFGQSDKPQDHHYTFDHMQEILDLVLAKLLPKGEKINLIAHDIGGPPAILWTSQNQARVKRLILLNTVIYPFSTPLDRLSHSLFEVPLLKNVLVSSFGLRTLIHTLSRSRGAAIKARINAVLDAHQNWTIALKLRMILEPLKAAKQNVFPGLAAKYQALQVSRHLIMARHDPLCYAHINKLKTENPQVPTHQIDDCGHFIPIDKPDELNAVLRQILDS